MEQPDKESKIKPPSEDDKRQEPPNPHPPDNGPVADNAPVEVRPKFRLSISVCLKFKWMCKLFNLVNFFENVIYLFFLYIRYKEKNA